MKYELRFWNNGTQHKVFKSNFKWLFMLRTKLFFKRYEEIINITRYYTIVVLRNGKEVYKDSNIA